MYYVYILLCSDKSLYTGITNNLKRRLTNHRSGNGSIYLYSKLPVRLVYIEKFQEKSEAAKRERQIKGWKKDKKIRILNLKID